MSMKVTYCGRLPMDGAVSSLQHFKERYPERIKILRILDLDWPKATSTYRQLATFIGDGICLGNEPLAFECLAQGLNGYEQALGRPDEERLAIFLDSLISPAVNALADIAIERAGIRWEPERGVPLTSWLDETDGAANGASPHILAIPANAERLRQVLNDFVLGVNHGG